MDENFKGKSAVDVALRDRRKPGHCWQDNELYDTFGPIIGPFAVLVYVQLTRLCYGAAIKVTLRELAQACGIGKDSVARSIGVMELVGMLKRTGAGEYQLADLKELAAMHGASFDPKRTCHVLSASQAATLALAVKEYLRVSQRKAQPSAAERKPSQLVAQSDKITTEFVAQSDKNLAAPAAESDKFVALADNSVALSGDLVALEGQVSSIGKKKTQEINTPSPTPPVPGGARAKLPARPVLPGAIDPGSEMDAAIDQVIAECCFTESRMREAVGRAMLAAQQKRRVAPKIVAELMIDAWRDYGQMQRFLRFTWSARKFFTEGYWSDWNRWPIDREAYTAHKNARLGMSQ